MQSADVIFQAKQYINAIAQGIDPDKWLVSKDFLSDDKRRIITVAERIIEEREGIGEQ